jgi:hypothetical protein
VERINNVADFKKLLRTKINVLTMFGAGGGVCACVRVYSVRVLNRRTCRSETHPVDHDARVDGRVRKRHTGVRQLRVGHTCTL